MSFLAEFMAHWAHTPKRLRKAVKDFEAYPTERNECYLIGYATALRDSYLLNPEAYTFIICLPTKVRADSHVRDTIRRAMS